MAGSSLSTRISLLVRLRDRSDDQAWQTFVDLYTPLIGRYGLRCGLQDADLQDVIQQVLMQVLRGIQVFEYDPERGRFRSWLGTIASREIQRHLKKARRNPQLIPADNSAVFDRGGHSLDPLWNDEFNAQILEFALQRVRPEFSADVWRAFEMVWLNDCPTADASQELEQSAHWIYQARYKILRRLKQEIEYLASDMPLLPREPDDEAPEP